MRIFYDALAKRARLIIFLLGCSATEHAASHQQKEMTMLTSHLSATSHKLSGRIAYYGLAVLYTYGLLAAVGTMTSQIL